MTETALHDRIEKLRPLGEAVCTRLEAEIRKLDLPERETRARPIFDLIRCHTEKDPYSGEETLHGIWTNHHGYRIGSIKFHGNGSFYAEFDVAEPHPTDPRWFVESVTAWGEGDTLKSEPQLLNALE
ncbi:hypothetical protein [Methylocaldum sp.]|uniref:hypothetical protein n=1 Tax=Methylocaldum sp. TaxID=1969727 RepID=UPI002D49870F|nr:hypothetical protein [Methylocaldum sp.]HYE37480.1 hypothetical protein [Methylocaldum sp.]